MQRNRILIAAIAVGFLVSACSDDGTTDSLANGRSSTVVAQDLANDDVAAPPTTSTTIAERDSSDGSDSDGLAAAISGAVRDSQRDALYWEALRDPDNAPEGISFGYGVLGGGEWGIKDVCMEESPEYWANKGIETFGGPASICKTVLQLEIEAIQQEAKTG